MCRPLPTSRQQYFTNQKGGFSLPLFVIARVKPGAPPGAMKGDNMKKIEKLEKYVITPNVGFYGGYIHTGEDILLCDDHDIDEGYTFDVKQVIKGDVLITDLKRTYTRKNGKKVVENSHQEVGLEKDQLLVYVQGMGFTIPEYKMCGVKEAIGLYELLEGQR